MRGFTLIELLTVIALVGLLLGLLLPAIQASRESSRRATCANNLRQIGIGMLAHADVKKEFPTGARGNSAFGTYGMSFWVELLPFMEESALFNQLDRGVAHCGSPVLHGANGQAIHRVSISFMSCPSSPLEPFYRAGSVEPLMPSYVGIAGATNHDGFGERRVSDCCITGAGGQISAGGMLIPNRAVSLAGVSDGSTNTILLAECSDYARTASGREVRIDGGFNQGWMTGTIMTGTPPNYTTTFAAPSYNLTTLRYGINERQYERPGIYHAHGPNNPLTSAHPGGVHALLVDGAVRFIANNISLATLKSLATRDDFGIVETE
jgi:prepilin-type N-terminal cleavage/methylation domain-containing protein